MASPPEPGAGPRVADPSLQDRGGPVRPGEELDAGKVHAWLAERIPALAEPGTPLPTVTQYAGGASNWTYRLAYPPRARLSHDEPGGPDRSDRRRPLDFVLRRPPSGTKAKSAHDMGREFKVQRALRPVYPAVPELVDLCDDEAVIGAQFYVMERLPGVILRKDIPPGLGLDAARTRALCINVIDKLVALHAVDYEKAGLASLGKGRGYARRQVEGWSVRYEKARTWNVPRFRKVRAWLAQHTPDDVATCVIHNDWRFDNVVLDPARPTEILGVLDWEMATLGDPLMDLGCALAYWVEAGDDPFMRRMRRQPTHAPGMLTRREVVEHYLARTGRTATNWPFYEVQGLFRLAVILQQIYYRYHHKQTRNPAFESFWRMVHYLHLRCLRVIAAA